MGKGICNISIRITLPRVPPRPRRLIIRHTKTLDTFFRELTSFLCAMTFRFRSHAILTGYSHFHGTWNLLEKPVQSSYEKCTGSHLRTIHRISRYYKKSISLINVTIVEPSGFPTQNMFYFPGQNEKSTSFSATEDAITNYTPDTCQG